MNIVQSIKYDKVFYAIYNIHLYDLGLLLVLHNIKGNTKDSALTRFRIILAHSCVVDLNIYQV